VKLGDERFNLSPEIGRLVRLGLKGCPKNKENIGC